jgi:hypothetical protein
MECLDAIGLTRKYQMLSLENNLQRHIASLLPAAAEDILIDPSGLEYYQSNPSLAQAVLRFGTNELAPWAFYCMGVQFISRIDLKNKSTYDPPRTWLGLDGTFTYPLLILQQVIQNAFVKWHKQINDFYSTTCPRASGSNYNPAQCSRQAGQLSANSPLCISTLEKCVDPVRMMVPRIRKLAKAMEDQNDTYYCRWCPICNTSLKKIASNIVLELHPYLVDCAARLDRSALRRLRKD